MKRNKNIVMYPVMNKMNWAVKSAWKDQGKF